MTLQFSLIAHAEEGISVYCDTAFGEYLTSVTVDDVIGITATWARLLQMRRFVRDAVS